MTFTFSFIISWDVLAIFKLICHIKKENEKLRRFSHLEKINYSTLQPEIIVFRWTLLVSFAYVAVLFFSCASIRLNELLQTSRFRFQVLKFKLQASSFKFQASSFKLSASSWKLQASSFKLSASSLKLQASSFKLQALGFKLQAQA